LFIGFGFGFGSGCSGRHEMALTVAGFDVVGRIQPAVNSIEMMDG